MWKRIDVTWYISFISAVFFISTKPMKRSLDIFNWMHFPKMEFNELRCIWWTTKKSMKYRALLNVVVVVFTVYGLSFMIETNKISVRFVLLHATVSFNINAIPNRIYYKVRRSFRFIDFIIINHCVLHLDN